jgi:hypothetical protein
MHEQITTLPAKSTLPAALNVRDRNKGATYTAPKKKTPSIASFCRIGTRNLHTSRAGNTRMSASWTIFGTELVIKK